MDVISRQAAQPEQIARDIATIIENEQDMRVVLKNAEHTETHSCDCERTETHDLVSRQLAIDSVCEVCENCEYFYNKKLIQTIKDLPPVQPRWIPVTLETLPNMNSVVVVCGKKGTWDYGTYRGWSGDIHSWQWKKNTIKHVYWWMYKADALPEPYKEEQDD